MDVIERELVSGMSQGPTGVVCMFGLPASHATRLAMQSAHAARQATAVAWIPGSSGAPRVRAGQCRPR